MEVERELIRATAETIVLLEKPESAAFAFPEFFQVLRQDMERVQQRLRIGDMGAETQALEQDIILTLFDMIYLLKKG